MKTKIIFLILIVTSINLNAAERISKPIQKQITTYISYSKSMPATDDSKFLNSSNAIDITVVYSDYKFKRINPYARLQLNMFSNTDANPNLFLEKNTLSLTEISANAGVELIIIPDKDFTPIFKIDVGSSAFFESIENDIEERIDNIYIKEILLYSFAPGVGIKYKYGNNFNFRALLAYRFYFPQQTHKTYELSLGFGYSLDI